MRRTLHWLGITLLAAACGDPQGNHVIDPFEDTLQVDGSVAPGVDGAAPGKTDTTGEHPGAGAVGDLGMPCGENSDCESGFCVEGPKGSVCSQTCLEECPDGWACKGVLNTASDEVFVCVPLGGSLCSPCTVDLQCNGGRCARIEDAGACSAVCEADGDCPPGYACKPLEANDLSGSFNGCIPPNHTCSCDQTTAGLKRTCFAINEHGKCPGFETCDPEAGWQGCSAKTPYVESCDGEDNDCDALVDEDLPLAQPCFNTVEGVGSCEGVSVCSGKDGWVCAGPVPSVEVCDYVDNDCDGAPDDPFKLSGEYTAVEHCGACGHSCVGSVPNGTPACVPSNLGPQCGVASCNPGFFPVNGKQCLPDLQTLCQPCAAAAQCYYPGAACLALEDGGYCTKPCTTGDDCPSGYGCSPVDGAGLQCVPETGSCTCDGKNLALQRECKKEVGGGDVPKVTCTGYEPCTATGWGGCVLPDDLCDGADNDCDGVVDNGFKDPATGKYTADDHCGQCDNTCLVLSFANGKGTCNGALPVPACQMTCDPGWSDVDQNPNDGCECHYDSATDYPYGVDSNCDGVDGEVQNAVFVAKDGNDGNPGTLEAPVSTIGKGVTLAQQKGKRDVYVATGVYVESVKLASGVAVYGGYSADFVQHEPETYETAIMGLTPTNSLPGAVNALGLGGTTSRLDGFTVFGENGQTPGQSSYALYVRDCDSGLTLSNNRVVAGDGAAGSDGASGTKGADGKAGSAGTKAFELGKAACGAADTNDGGTGATGTCGGVDVGGGAGGSAVCPDWDEAYSGDTCNVSTKQTAQSAEKGKAGKNNPDGGGTGGGPGGDGSQSSETCSKCNICHLPPAGFNSSSQNGAHGDTGASGAAGSGCGAGAGSVSDGLWMPGTAGSGADGEHGGGGGGGGAGGGVETIGCSGTSLKYSDIGGSGGGGGSAGCRGTGGGGGGGGGGSFGIFIVFTAPAASLPILTGNDLLGGHGGHGGHGGAGGAGGSGGSGGNGGADGPIGSSYWCTGKGATGGDGGNGGHGGGGAGGCGGAAYAVFVTGQGGLDATPWKATNSVTVGGAAGAAGPGGYSPGKSGQSGAAGAAGGFNF